jgi:hypothetical protein
MKISVSEDGSLILEEVYNSVILRTSEGNELALCMRDDTIEMKTVKSDKWHRANMESGDIYEM